MSIDHITPASKPFSLLQSLESQIILGKLITLFISTEKSHPNQTYDWWLMSKTIARTEIPGSAPGIAE